MACKANCCCCKCTKKTARHKRTKKKSVNGRRPFAPFYSTSTISKAVNSVYGPPMPITRTSYMPGEHRGGPPELKPEIALSFRDTPLTNHPEHRIAFASLIANHGLDSVGQATRTGDANAMQTTTAHNHPHVNNHGVGSVSTPAKVPEIHENIETGFSGTKVVPDAGINGLTFSTGELPAATSQSTPRFSPSKHYMLDSRGKPVENYAGSGPANFRRTPPSDLPVSLSGRFQPTPGTPAPASLSGSYQPKPGTPTPATLSGTELADGIVSDLAGCFNNAMTPVPIKQSKWDRVSQSGGSLTSTTAIYSFGDDSPV